MSVSASPARRRQVVVDASVILAWYLPAEPFKEAALSLLEQAAMNRLVLCVPTLTRFEVVNVLAIAVREVKPQQRLSLDEAAEILAAYIRAPLQEHPVTGVEHRMMEIAIVHRQSAYDAAYLALAESLRAVFVTADARLYRAVRQRFPNVKLIGATPGT